jgi:hypothetical protein
MTTLIDEACWERGCPCHDERESKGVAVVRRDWVGLTDEEIYDILHFSVNHDEIPLIADFMRAVEAKLKEKNT